MLTYLVYQSKGHVQRIRNRRRSFRTARIRADDDGLFVVGYPELNVVPEQVSAVQVVDGNVEEALILRVVQVHRDDMVRPGAGQQVRNQRAGLSDPLLVAALWLKRQRLHGLRGADGKVVKTIDRLLRSVENVGRVGLV